MAKIKNKKVNTEFIIQIKNVSKKYGEKLVVDNLSLNVKKGDFVTLLGPSGCGKTTTLRMIAGFEKPSEGQILFNDEDISTIPPYKRSVNTVFQKYALFPHLDVFENIAFGLKLKKVEKEIIDKNGNKKVKKVKISKDDIKKKVARALKIVNLTGYEKRDVLSLSGGQQQRVAIARAIVNEPEVLLLDEPLGALDLKMRKEMQEELKEMHKKLGITFIYVTHDQEEALTMSDTIIVMREGIICQEGTPTDIYNEPNSMFVANFIGESNIFNAVMKKDKLVYFLKNEFECVDEGFKKDEQVDVVIRPEDVEIVKLNEGQINGVVLSSSFKGVHYEMQIQANGYDFIAHSTKEAKQGSEVGIYIDPFNIQIMKKEFFTNEIEAEILSKNEIKFDGSKFEIDPKIFEKYDYLEDDETVKIDDSNKRIDLKGQKALFSVSFDDIELMDHEDDAQLAGNIEFPVYKGNRWEVSIISDSFTRYAAYTKDQWDDDDRVGIKIKPESFKLVRFLKNEE